MPILERAKFVSDALSIKDLCLEYQTFLKKYGDYEGFGVEVYGYKEDYINPELIPCVIGATKLHREEYKLKKDDIVISNTGYEGCLVVLDNTNCNVFEVDMKGNRLLIAKSFDTWFTLIKSN